MGARQIGRVTGGKGTAGLRKGQAMQEGETTEGATCGKAAVRELLIEPLDRIGLVRGSRVKAADHEAQMRMLAEQLAYMAPDNLMTLCEVVRDNAREGVWPPVWLVLQWSKALQPRPVEQARVIGSWLGCIEGPKAEAAGYLVELYLFLVRVRRPPNDYEVRRLQDEAAENARQMILIEGRVERDTATDEDRRWRARYKEDTRIARGIVDEGRRKRAGEQAA